MSNIQLYNGDCLKIMNQLISRDVKVDAIIADIPYGTIILLELSWISRCLMLQVARLRILIRGRS